MIVNNSSNILAALVSVAIERSLNDINDKVCEKIGTLLYKKYESYFYNCLDHPEYLVDILKNEFGDGYLSIIKTINNKLEEFSYQKPISEFLLGLNT